MTRTSRSQVDRLGERLRHGDVEERDLLDLDEFRRSFSASYDHVIGVVTQVTGVAPSGRPAKSTTAIIDKLRRESIRLSQIQDIAGCRLIVPNTREQDALVEKLRAAFERVAVVDRRAKPSHGYRAVHVIVEDAERPVEIQIRTSLQHLWAEFSEKLSDMLDPSIKYGGGQTIVRESLQASAVLVRDMEALEVWLIAFRRVRNEGALPSDLRLAIENAEATFARAAHDLRESMEQVLREIGQDED